jgi:hypothetical protein
MRHPLGGAYGRTPSGISDGVLAADGGGRAGQKEADVGGGGLRASCMELLIVEHSCNLSC